jgi:hypothetical protein
MEKEEEESKEVSELPKNEVNGMLSGAGIQQVMAPSFLNFNGQQQPLNLFGYQNFHSAPIDTTISRNGAPPPSFPFHFPSPISTAGVVQMPSPVVQVPPPAVSATESKNTVGNKKRQAESTSHAGSKKAKKPPKPPSQKTGKKQGKGGGHDAKYTKREDQILLTAMEKYKPIGNIAFKQVESYFNQRRPEGRPERDDKSLRRRFATLVETKVPTGDPNIPEEVLEAKRIEEAIKAESLAVVLGDPDVAKGSPNSGEVFLSSSSAEEEESGTKSKQKKDAGLKTTGLEAGNGKGEEGDKKNKRGRPRKHQMNVEEGKNTTDKLLSAMITMEKLQHKRERERERRKDRRDKKNMKLMMGVLLMGVNKLSKKKTDEVDVKAAMQFLESSSSNSSNSSESSLSSIDSKDSPPTKRAKRNRGKN